MVTSLQKLFQNQERSRKPREHGITHVLDKGMSVAELEGLFEAASDYVDIIKFGWGTSVVVQNLDAKIDLCNRYGIDFCCGGSLFELAVMRNKLDEYIAFLKERNFKLVELSEGVIEIPKADKQKYLERLAKEFKVLSEVGSKDSTVVVAPYRWVRQIKDELAAGAWKMIMEGRESGTVGLYRQTGEIRTGLIEEIEVEIDPAKLIFEGPQMRQQVWLVQHFGCNANLGNIAPRDVISLETLRQGLRSDTMMHPQ
ncbi:MAG: phosphosulfolactate synthase [Gammaproteobacteria bacterium]|nr:phosphosulfolactate synthase [Gammaproteobacteria bacterium]